MLKSFSVLHAKYLGLNKILRILVLLNISVSKEVFKRQIYRKELLRNISIRTLKLQ